MELDESQNDLFEIINLGTQQQVDFVTSISVENGKTVAKLQIASGDSVQDRVSGGPTLVDGRYQLNVNAARVGFGGLALDGNGDGVTGDSYAFGADAADKFFRFFGDTDGDGGVDGQDYGRFGLTFLRDSTDPAYNRALDYDGDGGVDGQDYGQFGLRFFKQV